MLMPPRWQYSRWLTAVATWECVSGHARPTFPASVGKVYTTTTVASRKAVRTSRIPFAPVVKRARTNSNNSVCRSAHPPPIPYSSVDIIQRSCPPDSTASATHTFCETSSPLCNLALVGARVRDQRPTTQSVSARRLNQSEESPPRDCRPSPNQRIISYRELPRERQPEFKTEPP